MLDFRLSKSTRSNFILIYMSNGCYDVVISFFNNSFAIEKRSRSRWEKPARKNRCGFCPFWFSANIESDICEYENTHEQARILAVENNPVLVQAHVHFQRCWFFLKYCCFVARTSELTALPAACRWVETNSRFQICAKLLLKLFLCWYFKMNLWVSFG